MDIKSVVGVYSVTAVLLIVSWRKSRQKTISALAKAKKMFANILPQFLSIMLLTGLLLAVAGPDAVRQVAGSGSGFAGVLIASLVGSIALIPVLAAFPVAVELMSRGAGVAQVTALLTALTMVGAVTLPVECRYLGKKAAILRNIFTYLFVLAASVIVEVMMS